MMADTLKWSTQLRLASSTSTTQRLQGDKITLPQSALEQLLAAAPVVSLPNGPTRNITSAFDPFNQYTFAAEAQARTAFSEQQHQLPHPLTFRLLNPANSRAVYAGIREFSAEEGTVGLSTFLQEALGLKQASPQDSLNSTRSNTPSHEDKWPTITVHAHSLPKGVYVRLRPLEPGYDPEDWKSLLERYLRDTFTTLTANELLTVPGARHEKFRFLVDKLEPEGEGICIVDTDLSVDIEALNEEQARETLNRKLAKLRRPANSVGGSSSGGGIKVGAQVRGQILLGDYVDYEVKEWDKGRDIEVSVEVEDDHEVDILVSPFSNRLRSKPRLDEHLFADFDGRSSKRLKISHTNVALEDAEMLNIAVYAHKPADESNTPTQSVSYTLSVEPANLNTSAPDDSAMDVDLSPDEVICKNCQQHIPKRTLALHEAFCYRNNVTCPHCKQVFLKNSSTWKSHWHCPHDDAFGNSPASREKHDSIFHPKGTIQCPSCDFQAFNIPILAQHRVSTCPGKEILCQFCHLLVVQKGPDDPSFTDPEVLLSGLTPHEYADGARTTECHICSRIVRLRDMRTHMRLHDRDRITKTKPTLCSNRACGRTIKSGDEMRAKQEQYGLCNECFGPLYISSYDPEGKMLRRRIERRLLQQLIGGCGKSWCHNETWCKTGYRNSKGEDRILTAKDALPRIKPVLDALTKGETVDLMFCVDEAAQTRKATAEMVAAEALYELEWCVKALEEEHNDLSKARSWLSDRAPKIGETVS